MIKITKKTDYGLTMLTILATEPDKRQSLHSISSNYHLPYKFIGQIAAILTEKSIIQSKEGSLGGYQLARSPENISLLEVIEALEGQPVKVDCLQGKTCPRQTTCHHHGVVTRLADTIKKSLSQTSIADLINESTGK